MKIDELKVHDLAMSLPNERMSREEQEANVNLGRFQYDKGFTERVLAGDKGSSAGGALGSGCAGALGSVFGARAGAFGSAFGPAIGVTGSTFAAAPKAARTIR